MLDALLSWDGWTVTQLPAEQAAIFRLEGVPPSEEFLFIQESEALEILFCRKGGLFWNGPATGVLASAPIRCCFSRSAQKRTGDGLLQSHSTAPLFGWKRKPHGRPCVPCTPTWESPSPAPGMIPVC